MGRAMTGFANIRSPRMCRRSLVSVVAAGGYAIGLQHLAVVKRMVYRSPTRVRVTGNTNIGGQRMVGRFFGGAMATHTGATDNRLHRGMVKHAYDPGIDVVACATIGRGYDVVVGFTGSIDAVVATVATFTGDGAVIK